MALATIEDLRRLLDSEPLQGQPRIVIGETGQITEESAQNFLDAMEGYVAARLGWTAETTDLMKMVHASVTAYRVWLHIIDRSRGAGEIPEYVLEWNRWAEDTLDVIKENPPDDTIPDASVVDITSLATNIQETEDEERGITLSAYVQLNHAPVILRSVEVRSDKDGGGTLYVEGSDYVVSYKTGEIKGLSTGTITNNQTVYVSYVHVVKGRFRWQRHRKDSPEQKIPPRIVGLDYNDYNEFGLRDR